MLSYISEIYCFLTKGVLYESGNQSFLSYIHCVLPLDYSCLNENGSLHFPKREINIFEEHILHNHLLSLTKTHDTLVIIGAPLGITWSVIHHQCYFHILGPIIEQQAPRTEINHILSKVSSGTRKQLVKQIETIPVLSFHSFLQYSQMFYYAVTGEKTCLKDTIFDSKLPEEKISIMTEETEENLKNCWLCEQRLYEAVKKGQRKNIRKIVFQFDRIALRKLCPNDSIRNKKNLSLFELALCVRASVHGGLPISAAYALEAAYTQKIEAASTLTNLSSINIAMLEDFSNRVHNIKLKTSQHSHFLVDVEEYIILNIENDIDLEKLAAEFDYTPYYFSHKYKKEKGLSIQTFIKLEKLKHACFLLTNTDNSIAQISEQLHFGTVSYFIAEFKKQYQTTPSAYREITHM